MTPVVEFTVAILVFEELQVPPLTVDENVVDASAHIVCVPERVLAVGAVLTVTVRVAVPAAQPPVPGTV